MKPLLCMALGALGCVGILVVVPSPAARAEDAATEGREAFNQYCSHCHGPDAVQGERPRNLRRLTKRYGDDRHNVFRQTVNQGRPDKGMPAWEGIIDDATFDNIWAFLLTVQTND
ncbi:c-type cytochrome [Bradyrhizobium tropiciagri]|uniref:c-type cytochrome n=1 Tax=Bradyrhizobium tropiciagri TaxID=312253 RepID=UPI001BABAD76|nr:c-type cytochrome [Bradyrhizobium tropiciagri]MBR0898844.1 c-type cytochrome [Bradyrhizobium tropiciagri]